MGGQFMRYQQIRYCLGNNGVLGLFTQNGTCTGLDYADFLLDQLAAKGRGSATGTWGHRFWRSAFFIQDDWKLRPNFTLNIGLRYEYMQPIYEVADRQVNVNTYTGELMYAGKNGDSRALYRPYKNQCMPRTGFARTPGVLNDKLVMRAGWAWPFRRVFEEAPKS